MKMRLRERDHAHVLLCVCGSERLSSRGVLVERDNTSPAFCCQDCGAVLLLEIEGLNGGIELWLRDPTEEVRIARDMDMAG